MIKRYYTVMLAGLMMFAFLSLPVQAQTESWSIGGGYWTLPNYDSGEVSVDTSGFYASVAMRAESYLLEFDYAIDDPGFYALATDYIYPLSGGESYFGGSSFVGAGYTYFSADELDNAQGFNVVLGAELSQGLAGAIRYDFLDGDQELFTIGVTYSF